MGLDRRCALTAEFIAAFLARLGEAGASTSGPLTLSVTLGCYLKNWRSGCALYKSDDLNGCS